MSEADKLVRQILDYLEAHIDLDHVARARGRHRAALDYAGADRAPIVFYLPYEGKEFTPYPYPEAFADPARMMVNELLIGFTSIYHAVDLRDDAPYSLRPNLGTTIIASMFGSEIRLVEDNPPWVMPFNSVEQIRTCVDGPPPDARDGLVPRALEQYAYFFDAVRDYPNCRAAFQFTLPDLQGPFSTAEMLWGSPIYAAFYDEPDLVRRLLDRITTEMRAVYRLFAARTHDTLGEGYCYQHAVGVKGSILIRDDSMINLSPKMYHEMVLPFDQELGDALGSTGIHFCGCGFHQIKNVLQISTLGSIDLGNPEMNDLDALYAQVRDRQIALLRLRAPAHALKAAQVKSRFPRGVVFAHMPASVSEAHVLLRQYEA